MNLKVKRVDGGREYTILVRRGKGKIVGIATKYVSDSDAKVRKSTALAFVETRDATVDTGGL